MAKSDPWVKICDDLKREAKERTDISKLHITLGDLYFTYKNTYQIELHLKVGKDLCQHYVDIALNGLENYKASDAGKEDAAKNFAKDLGLDLSDLDLLTSGYQLEQ